jgi:hypothetical protein
MMAAGVHAGWHAIDLDGYAHGRVLDGTAVGPTTIRAENFHQPDDQLVAFDTRERGTRDQDLQGPDGESGYWTRGNIEPGTVLGTALVVQDTGQHFAGYKDASKTYVAEPDDEEQQQNGRRPGAGEITFRFDQPVEAFLFTLIDVEPTEAFQNRTSSYVVFGHGFEQVMIAFAELTDPDSPYYDPNIEFGDHSANHFPVISAVQMGLPGIDRVVINLGGSGAVAGLSYFEDRDEHIGFAEAFEHDIGVYGLGLASFGVSGDEPSNPPGGGGGGPGPSPKPGGGGGGDDPISVPTPTAAIAGLTIMGILLGRRGNRKRG